MEYNGYAGNILYVDLTTGKIEKKPLDINIARKLIGGAGINYKLAYDLIEPAADPFSPDSPIIIGVGPMIGTLVPSASKIQVTHKCPLPGSEDNRYYIATATAGSDKFGAMMKSAGYDHVVITGKAKSPVYLKIIDDDIELCDASNLWGQKNIFETTDEMITSYGTCGVIAIGQAGENLVRFAMAFCDYRRHLGRSGLGASIGSKNLKAIVVQGTKGVKAKDPQRLMKSFNEVFQRRAFTPLMKGYHKVGLNAAWRSIFLSNCNPGNWSIVKWDNLYGNEKVWNKITETVHACNGCSVGCKVASRIPSGKYKGLFTQASHFTIPSIIGQRLDINDHREAIKITNMLDSAGIDYMVASEMIDWVTRLYEEGRITERETEGLVLRRNFRTYCNLINKIIKRDGIGNIMGEGWFALSNRVGYDATTDYMQGQGIAKGSSCIYPGRAAKLDPMRFTMGVTNPRGGHSQQGHSFTAVPLQPMKGIERDARTHIGVPDDALARILNPPSYYGEFDCGRLTSHVEDQYAIYGSLGTCTTWATFGYLPFTLLAELYSAITGQEIDGPELKRCGERVYNLYKLLNVREGFSRKDDMAPPTWFQPLMTPDGPIILTDYYHTRRMTPDDVEKMKDSYYDERGWSKEEGIPTTEKLTELELSEIIGISNQNPV